MKSVLPAELLALANSAALGDSAFEWVEQLFDHIPETAFFVKDSQGRYLAVNHSLVERCGLQRKEQLLGKTVREIFPRDLGEMYAAQDQAVLRTGRAIIDRLELHWYAHRRPGWCLTTKLPVHDDAGRTVGLAGISRDLRAPEKTDAIPASLAEALRYLETHYDDSVSPGSLASRAGLPPVRFARLIKRIYRLTPNQLILQTRLNVAARLLAETEQPVADIAHACGFYDHSALTRAFRLATFLTPTQFRASKRAGQP